MKHHISIDPQTMDVLRRSTVTATSVKLPAGQLARPLYEAVNKVLLAAGGKWNRSAQAHVFSDDPRETLGLATTSGVIKDTKKASQAFYTPASVANTVVAMASVQGKVVLEPSAGHGALADRCRDGGAAQVVCVESDPKSAKVLRANGHYVVEDDFMKVTTSGFDRVVMNPPFEKGQDVDHVTRAFSFLNPGGRLVAIMSPSWISRADKRSKAFRALLESVGHIAEHLSSGTFKESGTDVTTVIVVLNKPL